MWTFDNVIETPWIDVPISEANINWDDLYLEIQLLFWMVLEIC